MEAQHKKQDTNVEQHLSQISANLEKCQLPISDRFQLVIDRAVRAGEEQHSLTRQHIEKNVTDVKATIQDLEISQQQYRKQEAQIRDHQQTCENLLRSLAFVGMNSRMNEVSDSHPKTFEWIFDDNIKRPWDSSAAWLPSSESIYWINGKAGSSKSTLMKFITNDPRTKSLLVQWSSDVVIVTHYL